MSIECRMWFFMCVCYEFVLLQFCYVVVQYYHSKPNCGCVLLKTRVT